MFHPRHLALSLFLLCPFVRAQNADTPVSIPAGAQATLPMAQPNPIAPKPPSPRQAREADDAYLEGAKQINRHDYAAAEQAFAHAVTLNPNDTDYTLAFAYAHEARVTELVRNAAIARKSGDPSKAAALLDEAHKLDPDNRIVAQHLSGGGEALSPTIDPLKFPAGDIASTLAGPPELAPKPGKRSFHERGDGQSVLRAVYGAFGIKVQFDPSVTNGPQIRFDLEDVDFDTATQTIHQITRTFAAAVQSDQAIIAKDTQDNRDRLLPQVEETLYLPGQTQEQMTELATLARNVFDIKNITASTTAGTLLIKADEPTLKVLNAQYADMLDGNSDVQLDVTLYEVDEATVRNFGVTLPSGLGVFPIATELQSAITSNAAAIAAAEQANLLTLTGTPLQQAFEILGFLYGAGLLTSTQSGELTGLLGTIGNYKTGSTSLPFLGVTITSGVTVNALYTSSDVRILDAIQARSTSGQPVSFRSGSRYPIITSTYSTGGSSALSSIISGLSPSLQAAASAAGIGSGTSTTIPQIQYEDLGLTLKATPRIQRNNNVNIQLELKIESLGAGSLNSIPELNNRSYTSTVTVPIGMSAILVSDVNSSELHAATGVPGLNDLPGFQGTEKDLNKSTGEILIAITPHIMREQNMRIASRRLKFPHYSTNPFD